MQGLPSGNNIFNVTTIHPKVSSFFPELAARPGVQVGFFIAFAKDDGAWKTIDADHRHPKEGKPQGRSLAQVGFVDLIGVLLV